MPDFTRFNDFAARVGAVTPVCYTCYTTPKTWCNTIKPNKINGVTPVTPVTPGKNVSGNEAELLDLYEERAAIMLYDGGLPRHEAEALAWKDIFGTSAKVA